MRKPRKTKQVRELEARLADSIADSLAQRRLALQMETFHKEAIAKLKAELKERKVEQVTRLISAIGQTQDSIGRALALLLDQPGGF